MSSPYRPGISCKQWSPHPALSFFSLSTLWSHSFHRLPHLPVSSPMAHLYSILSWSFWPEKVYSSRILLPLFHISVFSQPSGPDNVLGPSKDDRTVPSTGWVRRQLKHPPSCAHSPRTPAGLQQHQHHWVSALKALSHSSLRALYFKHLRDYVATVINLQGPICQHCDCFLLSL